MNIKYKLIVLLVSIIAFLVITFGFATYSLTTTDSLPVERPDELTLASDSLQSGLAHKTNGLVIGANPLSVMESNYLVAIIVLSFTCLISISITFYLYRWRKILLSHPSYVIPEEWAKYLNRVGEGLASLNKKTGDKLQVLEGSNRDLSIKVLAMTDTYMDLQAVLDEKDKEIKRLKNGYDSEIFRKFIARFARVEQALQDIINEESDNNNLRMLARLFEDAFSECGVEKYEPILGSDYRTTKGVSDNPKIKLTNEPSLDFKILEVIESGYELISTGNRKTIIPSKVRIYKLDKESQ